MCVMRTLRRTVYLQENTMRKITTITTMTISLLLLVVACRGCGNKNFEQQLKNAASINKGASEWQVWWKLGSPHSRERRYVPMLNRDIYDAHYRYGNSTITLNYWDSGNGTLSVVTGTYSRQGGEKQSLPLSSASRWE